MCKFKRSSLSFLLLFFIITNFSYADEMKIPKYDWSFKGITGTFDRSSLQRGYQVYTEVCASCHSMNLLSYRNLGEKGGPEFSVEQVKAIAANFEVTDGPNSDGEMFTQDQEDLLTNLYRPIQILRLRPQLMAELIHQICRF